MNKYELVSKIEKIAPLETQEDWDCSGWIVDTKDSEVKKVMLALTITDDVVNQAKQRGCDMIVSHHPMFSVPLKYKDINIYASHTPMDKAKGGTTETLIQELGYQDFEVIDDFVRRIQTDIRVNDFRKKLEQISNNVRLINNNSVENIKKIAFCAGSGADFIECTDADAFVTGDLKYHTAVETNKVVFDIGHFESEILVLKRFKEVLGIDVEIANEKSPFI